LKVEKTHLEGVLLINPPTRFEDYRGHYIELYDEATYKAAGIDCHFTEDDISVSRRHVLRGIHGDAKTAKLVSCLQGSFYLVVIDNRPRSPQFRQWGAFTLSEWNRQQVFVPAGFGNGHVVMTETAIFHYKQTSAYDRATQFTLYWDDPDLKLWWPVKDPIVSQRDDRRAGA
jgi:dTDP-4-dehydrorhamnose 3,5-epimerase